MSDVLQELRRLMEAKRYPEARQLLLKLNHPKAKEWLAKLDGLEAAQQAPRRSTRTPDDQEALTEVRRLVTAKRYDEARHILRGLTHPKAQEWLEKIDALEARSGIFPSSPDEPADYDERATPGAMLKQKVVVPVEDIHDQPEKQKRHYSPPWNPSLLVGMTFFVTNIGSGMALAWNWRKLGKSEWMWWSLAGTFSLLFTTVMLVLALAKIGPQLNPSLHIPLMVLVVVLIMSNALFPLYLAFLQGGAYRKWQRGDIEGMLNHDYPFGRALLSAAGMGGIVLGIAAVSTLGRGPRSHSDEVFSLTYPANWNWIHPNSVESCRGMMDGARCLIVLGQSPSAETNLSIVEQPIPYTVALQDFEPLLWRDLKALGKATLDSNNGYYEFTLDGFPVVQRFYTYALPDESGYEMMIALVDGQRVLFIFATAPTRDILRADLPEIEEIYKSINFKSNDG